MTMRLNDAAANYALDQIRADFNSGFLDCYAVSGSPPSENAAATGTLLVSVAAPASNAFAAASARACAKLGTWQGVAAALGTAKYARLRNPAGSRLWQFNTVGVAGGAAVAITSGADVGTEYELTCGAAHGLVLDQRVTIAGHSHAGANGTWYVSAVSSATVFRITYDAGGASGTGGTSTPASGLVNLTNVLIASSDVVTATAVTLSIP